MIELCWRFVFPILVVIGYVLAWRYDGTREREEGGDDGNGRDDTVMDKMGWPKN
jgi:hypothetical protein